MIIIFLLIGWFRCQLDTNPCSGTEIVLDSAQHPHIFYYSEGNLMHCYQNYIRWQHESVSPAVGANGHPSVYVDDQDHFYIAFCNGNYNLSYGYYDGIWHLEVVDTTTNTGDWCALVLDSNLQPHIAYHHSTGWYSGYLRYAEKVGGVWQIYEDTSEYGGYYVSADIDDQDCIHVSDCTSWSGGELRYLVYDGQNWSCEKPITSGVVDGYNDIILDGQGRPQISYYWIGNGSYDLRFVEKNSGNWQIHIVDHGQRLFKRGWDNRIEIDNSGIIHIIYHCHNEGLLKHAWGDGSSWSTEIVDTIGGYNASTGIVIDTNNNIYVSYCDEYDPDPNSLWLASTNPVNIKERKIGHFCENYKFPTINRFLWIKDRFKIYDAAGRIILDDNYPSKSKVQLRKAGVYFLKSDGAIQKIVIIQ